jgi:hypothetical protein
MNASFTQAHFACLRLGRPDRRHGRERGLAIDGRDCRRRPTTFTAVTLQALPQVTQTDTFASGTAPRTHTWTGPTL